MSITILSDRCSMDDVRSNPNMRWNREGLSYNPYTNIDVITINLPNTIGEWNWYYLSMCIPMDDILKYPYLPWNRGGLSHNESITIDITQMDLPNAVGEWDYY